jgi:RNA polymerase sigma factor (sigma-70 family)
MAQAEEIRGNGAGARAEPPDGVLLARFTAHRDEAAFAALVQRHGPLVFGVCRRALGHKQDAEDAFQVVFRILARKAGSIRQEASVGAWLHAAAYRVARRAKADQARRRMRQKELVDIPDPDPPAAEEWRELWPIVDEEVNRLPELYRQPFILCCLEGMTNEQAATQLGCPLGTVLSRLSRARDRLCVRLSRRGFALSATTLAALGLEATAGTRSGLTGTTVQTARRYAAAQPVSAGVAALADGLVKALAWTKWQVLFGSLAGSAILVGVVVLRPVLRRDADLGPAPALGNATANSLSEARRKLQGTWSVATVELAGAPLQGAIPRMIFTEERCILVDHQGAQTGSWPYTLDPSTDPPTIDFQKGEVTSQGIYRLAGDTLTICLNNGQGSDRPNAFSTMPNDPSIMLFVLRREPPGPDAS